MQAHSHDGDTPKGILRCSGADQLQQGSVTEWPLEDDLISIDLNKGDTTT